MRKHRLDELLLKNKLIENKEQAFVKVTEGAVFVDGQKAISPAQLFPEGAKIVLRERGRYVGRGAYKLEAVLREFQVDVSGKICADIGAATGGFTQVLLERGAKKVYAIDTARGKLDLKVREDERVVVLEETDIRDLAKLPERIEVATIDVSLISLRNILPHVRNLLSESGVVVVLFKPQYEIRNPRILHHGVIKDDAKREELFLDFIKWCEEEGWKISGKIESPIKGDKGNKEYLLLLTR